MYRLMYRRAVPLVAAVLTAVSGCGDDAHEPVVIDSWPVVSMTASASHGTEPLTVQFGSIVSGGNGPLAFAWDFGDGETSTLSNPGHVFMAAGSPYDVMVTVTDADGDVSQASMTVMVGADDQPTVAASASPTVGPAPLAVDFSCVAAGGNEPVDVSWSFGDGAGHMAAVTSYTYTEPGVYRALCHVVDMNGDVVTQAVDIRVGSDSVPRALTSAAPAGGRAPVAIDFVGTVIGGDGVISHSWSFGDGETATGAIATHTYEQAGVYTAALTVMDEDGDQDTAAFTVVIGDDAPRAFISAVPAGGQAPVRIAFRGTAVGGDGAISYAWRFGDGGTGAGATTARTYGAAGVYTAALTVTDEDGDSDTATFEVVVVKANVPPVVMAEVVAGACAVTGLTQVQVDAAGSTDPEGAALRYAWSFVRLPAGSNARLNDSMIANPSFVPDVAGVYELRVLVSDGENVVASEVLAITSDGPASLAEIAGNGQVGGAGTELAMELEVEVRNACGAPVPFAAVQWTGDNAEPAESVTFTDERGRATSRVALGSELGTASVTATLLGVGDTVSFSITVEPGPLAMVMMDAINPVVVSATRPRELTFRATDAYGHLVSEEVSFDVSIAVSIPSSARLDSDGDGNCATGGVTRLGGVTTTDGVVTVEICNTVVENAYLVIDNVLASGPGPVRTGGYITWISDDYEIDNGRYFTFGDGNLWSRGTPTYPPGLSGYSGANVRGTVLGGPIDTSSIFVGVSLLETWIDTTYPIGSVYSAFLEFKHYYDTTFSNDVGCYTNVQLWSVCFGCELLIPEGDYNGSDCLMSGAPGYVGTNDSFTPVRFDVSSGMGTGFPVLWTLTYYPGSGDAGWYIDDLRVWGAVQYPRVTFVAGP